MNKMNNNFSSTEEIAKQKFAKYQSCDPFPEIAPALLNSADISDYVESVGMIFPFDNKQLKPATYALKVLGKYIFWTPEGNKIEGVLKQKESLKIPKDSIVFLTLEPLIQLPEYIAARFNLKIDIVYRGLLLGTGPIIDPGFVGQLSIPVHNFTSNDYYIRGGETFIWMEFTKVSVNKKWLIDNYTTPIERHGEIKVFNEANRNKEIGEYITEADCRSIQSSIPLSVTLAADSAKKAGDKANLFAAINIALVVAVLGVIGTVFFQTIIFYRNSKIDLIEYQKKLFTDDTTIIHLRKEIDTLKMKIK